MKKVNYVTSGTCSRNILFEIADDNTIHNISFIGGCNGNLKGISKLVEGKNVDDIIHLLKNIKCGNKNTSCPDQLARALEESKIG